VKHFALAVAALSMVQACLDPAGPPAAPHSILSNSTGLELSHDPQHLWAVIDRNGHLVRGSRVTGVVHLGVGKYEITFARNVTQCAYLATTVKTSRQANVIFPASGHRSVNGVYVEIKDQTSILRDGPFNLVVVCNELGNRFAVIGYSRNLVRATPGTILNAQGSGGYHVTFATSVRPCSYIATVADPGNGSVALPGVVATARSSGDNSVFVQTFSLAGGDQEGFPVHLAVVCSSTQASRYAVVRYDGVMHRSSPATSSGRIYTGRDTITTDRDLTTCAAVATRGSIGTRYPSPPATLEVIPGSTANSVGFQIRRLLVDVPRDRFGGTYTNQEFHAALLC
jgi:hypothetical protein